MVRYPLYTLAALLAVCLAAFQPSAVAQIFGDQTPSPTQTDRLFGDVEVDISDSVGRPLKSWVHFADENGNIAHKASFERGVGNYRLPEGRYTAHVLVAYLDAPFLVDAKSIDVSATATAYVLVSLAEGSGSRELHIFDQDLDLVLDRVEIQFGTDPNDPSSIPGRESLHWESPVLDDRPGWYVGDLHSYSNHSLGSESVRKLVRRAERAKLDFLAITDRNTMASTQDEHYRSDKTVLIPAIEWGNETKGFGLIYRPGTYPQSSDEPYELQRMIDQVVAQGGVFAPSHPCFPIGAWKRTSGHYNAIEVWCRAWSEVPPLSLESLDEHLRLRKQGKYIYPIAAAAHRGLASANGQAELFWEEHLRQGMKSAAIGGSHSASPKVELGAPLTHVYAEQKSLESIVKGIRLGRTMIRRDENAPLIDFQVDALNNGKVETKIGGIIPIREESRFVVRVTGGNGKRLEVLMDGLPIRSMVMIEDDVHYEFFDRPTEYSFYSVRVTEAAESSEFGFLEVLAMTSPIYAQEIIFVDPETGESNWVQIDGNDARLPRNLPQLPEQP